MPFKRLNITSQLVSTNTRASTSNVTGALLLSGGAGIRGNVYADNIVLTGNLSVGSISSTGTINASSISTSNGQVLNFPSSSGTIITTGSTGIVINDLLSNSNVTIGTTTISLGSTSTALTGLGNTSTVRDGASNTYSIGFKEIPQSSTPSGALGLNESGKHVYVSAGVTVPPSSNSNFTIGTVITIINSSASSITITQGTGVTMRQSGTTNTGNRTLSSYGLCSIIKVATDTWYISGSGVS
jgi:hypothetical protein